MKGSNGLRIFPRDSVCGPRTLELGYRCRKPQEPKTCNCTNVEERDLIASFLRRAVNLRVLTLNGRGSWLGMQEPMDIPSSLSPLRYSASLEKLCLESIPKEYFPPVCELVIDLPSLSLLLVTGNTDRSISAEAATLTSRLRDGTPPPSLKTVTVGDYAHVGFLHHVEWLLRPRQNFVLEKAILQLHSLPQTGSLVHDAIVDVLKSARTVYLDLYYGAAKGNQRLQNLFGEFPSRLSIRTLCLPNDVFDPENHSAVLPPFLEDLFIVFDRRLPALPSLPYFDQTIHKLLERSRLRRLRRLVFVMDIKERFDQYVSSHGRWTPQIIKYIDTVGGLELSCQFQIWSDAEVGAFLRDGRE